MVNLERYSEQEVFEMLKQILREVAPVKVVGEITLDTSLQEDFGFDSIDFMDLLLKIQEVFVREDSEPINVERFISCAYNGSDGRALTVRTICNLIMENLTKRAG